MASKENISFFIPTPLYFQCQICPLMNNLINSDTEQWIAKNDHSFFTKAKVNIQCYPTKKDWPDNAPLIIDIKHNVTLYSDKNIASYPEKEIIFQNVECPILLNGNGGLTKQK